MATNLGERIQRKALNKYSKALGIDWFQNFLVKYRGEKNTAT
jgi:hypothetical protein